MRSRHTPEQLRDEAIARSRTTTALVAGLATVVSLGLSAAAAISFAGRSAAAQTPSQIQTVPPPDPSQQDIPVQPPVTVPQQPVGNQQPSFSSGGS